MSNATKNSMTSFVNFKIWISFIDKKNVIKWSLIPPNMFEIVLKFFTSFTRCLGKSLWIPYTIIQKCKVNRMGKGIIKNTASFKATIKHCPTSIMPSPACFPKYKELPHILFLNVFLGIPIDGYHKGKNDTGLNENGIPFGAEFSIFKILNQLVWPVQLAQVFTTSSTDFSFQNLVFWNLFEFSSGRIHLKFNISHILIQILQIISLNSAH